MQDDDAAEALGPVRILGPVSGRITMCPAGDNCALSMATDDYLTELSREQNADDFLRGHCGDPARHVLRCPACKGEVDLVLSLLPGEVTVEAACPCGRAWVTPLDMWEFIDVVARYGNAG